MIAVADEHRARGTYGEALQWYFDAADAGNAQAQFLLGLKFFQCRAWPFATKPSAGPVH